VDRSLCIDEAVVRALAVLRVSPTTGGWVPAGTSLAAGVVVRALAVLRVPHADWRCPDAGDWGVADNGGRINEDAWVPAGTVTLPLAAVDRALTPVAAECPPHAGCGRLLVAAVPRDILLILPVVLAPPPLRACTPPSTLFEPVADHPALLGRLTLGGVSSSSSHSDLGSAQSSGPATFPGGESGGGEGGGEGLSELESEPVRGEFSQVRR
jgi:hypothetical protein